MKRDSRLHGLTSAHHHALVLVRRIRDALEQHNVEERVATGIVQKFDSELEPHFRIEEELLLPHLDSGVAFKLAERTRSEHQEIRALIDAFRAGRLDLLARFADALEAHVRFEERELFPVCESMVPGASLEEVARRGSPHQTSSS